MSGGFGLGVFVGGFGLGVLSGGYVRGSCPVTVLLNQANIRINFIGFNRNFDNTSPLSPEGKQKNHNFFHKT